MTTIGSAWRQARDRLRATGIETASLDARLLAGAAFGLDAVALAARENQAADTAAVSRLAALTKRRLAREPVARILGEKQFYGLDFALSPATLVPRPETELLVDLALATLKERAAPRLIDLGTGSGCIVIAVLANHGGARALATDVSAEALATARENAERHGVADRLDLREGDWFAPVADNERFDLVVSNPPYVVSAEIELLDRDVRDHDPCAALDGGADGLAHYDVLARQSGRHLEPGGTIIVEHGAGQAEAVVALLDRHGFVAPVRHVDLNGHRRALVARWPGRNGIGEAL